MRVALVSTLAFLTIVGGMACTAKENTEVRIGGKAPEFKLKGSDGKEYTLKQFAGKRAVVIAWFPKAFTGG